MKIQTTFDEIVESLELDKKMIKRFTVKDPPTGGICTIAYARRGNPSMSTPFTEGSRIVGLKGSLFDGQMDFFIHEKRGYDSLSIPGGGGGNGASGRVGRERTKLDTTLGSKKVSRHSLGEKGQQLCQLPESTTINLLSAC